MVKSISTDMASSDTKGAKGRSTSSSTEMTVTTVTNAPARLCYVDDSRTSAYVVKRMLRPYGYIVDHFDTAEPALIALIQENYDLLLTDLKVSPNGMDGDDLVRALRNSGQNKISSLPIIVITGSTDSNVLEDVYKAGANQIMTKPVNGEELHNHIRKLVFVNAKASQVDHEPIDSAALLAQLGKGSKRALYSATVLPFGPDSKTHKTASDLENAIEDPDAIPILNPPGGRSTNGPRRILDNRSASQGIDANEEVNVGDDPRFLSGDGDRADLILPRPMNISVPAARVRPTITVNPDMDGMDSDDLGMNERRPRKTLNSSAAARQEAAMGAKAAVQAAQQTQLSNPRKIQAASTKKNAEAAAALKKLKSAAVLKKAQLAKRQRDIAAARAAEAEKRDAGNEFSIDHLSLEPLGDDDGAAGTFNTTRSSGQNSSGQNSNGQNSNGQNKVIQNKHIEGESTRHTGEQKLPELKHPIDMQGAAGSKPAQLRHPMDGGKIESQPNFTPFPQSNGLQKTGQMSNADMRNQFLQEMDRFPLAESDINESFTTSRFISALTSIVELYGVKKILMMAAVITVLFVTFSSWSTLFDEGTPVDISIVEQGEIYQSINVPGKVVSKLRVELTPAIAGRLTEVLVDEGDTVNKGALLARLDDREANSFLKRAEASFGSAKEDVLLAQRSLERLTQAFKKGAVARQLVEDAEVDLRSAQARESIAEEEVRTAKVNLENPRILAPFSGVVTARFVEVGQWVVPSETLFTLIDPKQKEIEVRVEAADSNGIAVGQTVGLSSDAFPGLEWSESVSRLAAATTNVGNSNTISVYVSLGSNAPSLRFGQQVDADIRVAWNPNAVKVPFGAIINREGHNWVALLEGNRARLVEVTTGIEDFSHIEILQGVSVGETIILANGKRLREGERVYLATD